ncbi:MAG TPA: MaoC family dehydratase N-terminal domain-containing protein [Acidimicrobiales bacterium]
MSGERVVTDDLARLAQTSIGGELAVDTDPHVEVATVDSIRAFARLTGDDNPLYCDEAYGRSSCLGSVVAPPLFPIATGTPTTRAGGDADELIHHLRALPAEVQLETWNFFHHVRPGTRLLRTDVLQAADRDSVTTLKVVLQSRYSANGVVYATRERTLCYGTTQQRSSADRRQRHRYRAEELEAIDAAYANEFRRGAHDVSADELTVGDELPVVVKGPLTITDLVALRAGVGGGPFGVEPLRLGFLNRQRRPQFYDRDESGAFDARERLHWDEGYARACGHLSAYDYTHTRLIWASQVLTNWIGDRGFVERLSFRVRAFNYVGDTHWMHARINQVSATANVASVELELWGINQLGTVTCDGAATVSVPVADNGASPSGVDHS